MEVDGQRHVPAALPPEKTQYPLYRRWGGPRSRSGRVRKISFPPQFKPHTAQGVESRYTNYAIPAHTHDYIMQTPAEGPAQPPIQWAMRAIYLWVKAAEPKG